MKNTSDFIYISSLFIRCKSCIPLFFVLLLFNGSIAFANSFSFVKRPDGLVGCPPPDNSKQFEVGPNSKTAHWRMCWGSLTIETGKLEGVWVDGAICRGNLVLNNGDSYAGEFRGAGIDGSGAYKTKEGSIYEGSFVNGKQEGLGVERHPGDLTMRGKYVSGKREGVWEVSQGNSTSYHEYKDNNFVRTVDKPQGIACGEEKDLNVCRQKLRERLKRRREELLSESAASDRRMIPDINLCPY